MAYIQAKRAKISRGAPPRTPSAVRFRHFCQVLHLSLRPSWGSKADKGQITKSSLVQPVVSLHCSHSARNRERTLTRRVCSPTTCTHCNRPTTCAQLSTAHRQHQARQRTGAQPWERPTHATRLALGHTISWMPMLKSATARAQHADGARWRSKEKAR